MLLLPKDQSRPPRELVAHAKCSLFLHPPTRVLQKSRRFNRVPAGKGGSGEYVHHLRKQKGKRFPKRRCSTKTYEWPRTQLHEDWLRLWGIWKVLWFFTTFRGKTQRTGKTHSGNRIPESESAHRWRIGQENAWIKWLIRMRRRRWWRKWWVRMVVWG